MPDARSDHGFAYPRERFQQMVEDVLKFKRLDGVDAALKSRSASIQTGKEAQ